MKASGDDGGRVVMVVVLYSNFEQWFHNPEKLTPLSTQSSRNENILPKKFSTWFYHLSAAQPCRFICLSAAFAAAVYCVSFTSWQATNPIQNGWRNRMDKPDYLGFRSPSPKFDFAAAAAAVDIVFDIIASMLLFLKVTAMKPQNRHPTKEWLISFRFNFLWTVTFLWNFINWLFPNR